MNTTFILSVSSESLNHLDIVKTMQELNMPCSVSTNYTINEHSDIENGCDIVVLSDTAQINSIWETLRDKYGFQDAYIEIFGQYRGYVHDYLSILFQKSINKN